MSLHGLDAPVVQEAYQAAIADAGGWFLLKYSTRDSVELLARGKGGVHEARNALANYREASPLYGLLIYRRRKVLIKYIPEGTSRLLQARTAVHFTDVLDAFSPHENLLEITTADGLNDTALAASFPLHTASPATSTNKLQEISEDAEDTGGMPRSRPSALSQDPSIGAVFGTRRYQVEKRVHELMESGGPKIPERTSSPLRPTSGERAPPASPASTTRSPQPQQSSPHPLAQLTNNHDIKEESAEPSTDVTPNDSPLPLPIKPAPSDVSVKAHADKSTSELSERPSGIVPVEKRLPELPSSSPRREIQKADTAHEEKPNKTSDERRRSIELARLASRDQSQLVDDIPRPRTSGAAEHVGFSQRSKQEDLDKPFDFSYLDRPKFKLGPRPVGYSDSSKRAAPPSVSAVPASVKAARQRDWMLRSTQQNTAPLAAAAAPPTSTVYLPPPIPDVPSYHPRPVSRSSIKSTPSHKSSTMTPDKIRLMKAVELRKKQLNKSQSRYQAPIAEATEAPNAPSTNDQTFETDLADDESEATKPQKSDSGIEMDYDQDDDRKHRQASQRTLREPPATGDDASIRIAEHESHTFGSPARTLSRRSTNKSQKFSPSRSASSQPSSDRTSEPSLHSVAVAKPELVLVPEAVPSAVTADRSLFATASIERQKPRSKKFTLSTGSEDSSADEESEASVTIDERVNSRRQNSEMARRRRGLLEPLHLEVPASTGNTPAATDTDLLSDEELMEELQSATVQEARKGSVARTPPVQYVVRRRSSSRSTKSPVSGTSIKSFPTIGKRFPAAISTTTLQKSPSETSTSSLAEAAQPPTPRSPPAVYVPTSQPGTDPMQGLKHTVSSGISKRIQALGAYSKNDLVSTDSQDGSDNPDRGYWVQQRGSPFRNLSKIRAGSFRSRRISAGSPPASESDDFMAAPAVRPTWHVQEDGPMPRNSMSVTARIVRPNTDSESANHGVGSDREFQHSNLLISHDHLPPVTAPQGVSFPPISTGPFDTAKSSEVHHASGLSPYATSPLGSAVKTPSADDFPVMPGGFSTPVPSAFASPPSIVSDDSATTKDGKATRFFKRMSGLGGVKRRSAILTPNAQPTRSNAPAEPSSLPSKVPSKSVALDRSEIPPRVVLGDLNVQFPDSLLWKRRWVEIDDSGNLTFAIPQAQINKQGSTKKFHLNEFRMPYNPDLDRQELPYSVMLDFVDGTTLQTACEDSMTHRHVLHLLRQYHRLWNVG